MKRITKLYLLNCVMLAFLIFPVNADAQTDNDNHSKYWYYRTRLTNDFVKIGPGAGESMPFNQRAPGSNTTPNLLVGDGTSTLGYYIGLLATEYYLLSQNNQSTTKVKHELFYALNAVNRLDYVAETQYGASPNLNGFFLRDDIPANFVITNYKHFNYFNTWDGVSTIYQTSDPSTFATDRGFHSKAPVGVFRTSSDWEDSHDSSPGNTGYGKDFAVSQDQVYCLIFGLALVNKFVPAWETDGNNVFGYGSGQTSLTQEARNITGRLVTHTRHSKDMNGNSCLAPNSAGWNIKNPVTCNQVPTGNDATAFSYAIAESGCLITSGITQNAGVASSGLFDAPKVCGPDGYPFSYQNAWAASAGYITWQTLIGSLVPNIDSRTQAVNLAAVCNCVYGTVADVVVDEIVTTLEQVPILSWLGVIIGWVWNLVSSIVSYIVPGFYINTTPTSINVNAYYSNPPFPDAPIDHAPLARKIIHGGPYQQNFNYTFKYLLDVAPCDNIYNYGTNDQSHYEWSSDNRLDHPNRRGQNAGSGAGSSPKGEYNAIDYMLYHNLWYIHKLQGGNNPNIQDLSDVYVNLNGATASQNVINAFETITTENTVFSYNASMAYWRAGKTIDILPGTEITAGSNLHAYIEKFECATDVGYFRGVAPAEDEETDSGEMAVSDNPSSEQTATAGPVKDPHFEDLVIEVPVRENYLETAMKNAYPDFSKELFVKPTVTPNHVRIYFTLQEGEEAFANLMDMSGKLIYTRTNIRQKDSGINIDLSDYSPGVYILKFTTTMGTEKTQKIVKE